MKKTILPLTIIYMLCTSLTQAQQTAPTTYQQELPQLSIALGRTLHIISPEPISYVDISSSEIIGDLPLDNILRLKLRPDSSAELLPHKQAVSSVPEAANLGTISITGDTFISQYSLLRASSAAAPNLASRVNILPIYMAPLDISGVSLSRPQIKNKALTILASRTNGKFPIRKNKEFGITIMLNGLYSAAGYIFIDLAITNHSNLKYDPDELRFFIEDKKIVKATNVQRVEIEPVFVLHPLRTFTRSFRNIYVLKKVSFPGSKVLKIALSERQISGRAVELKIKYRDVLDADTI